MNAVRKYYWKINIQNSQADAGHPALEHLASRTFEMETLDPPPEVGESFTLYVDVYDRSSPSDRCVEVTVQQKRQMLEYRQGRPMEGQWYVSLAGKITGSAPLP